MEDQLELSFVSSERQTESAAGILSDGVKTSSSEFDSEPNLDAWEQMYRTHEPMLSEVLRFNSKPPNS